MLIMRLSEFPFKLSSAEIIPETALQGQREILVGLTDSIVNATQCGFTAPQRMAAQIQEIFCQPGPIEGRYITIRTVSATRLVLGYVEVSIVGYGKGYDLS